MKDISPEKSLIIEYIEISCIQRKPEKISDVLRQRMKDFIEMRSRITQDEEADRGSVD